MNQFVMQKSLISMIGEKVAAITPMLNYASSQMAEASLCQVYGDCGCGPGGSCASSCVSGCAERGGCGPHGPR